MTEQRRTREPERDDTGVEASAGPAEASPDHASPDRVESDWATPDQAGPDEAHPDQARVHSAAPETGDIVIDSALSELAGVEPGDLDGQLAAGESLHRTLQARLSDLGN